MPRQDGRLNFFAAGMSGITSKSGVTEVTTLNLYSNFQEVANQACEHLPDGFVLSIELERGAASVDLTQVIYGVDRSLSLPDSADKTLAEQVNDAIQTAVDLCSP